MLSKLRIEIESEANLNFNSGSIFHGYLMNEVIDRNLLDEYHSNELKTFSQKCYREKDKQYWEISTVDGNSYKDVIEPLLSEDINKIFLRNRGEYVQLIKKELTTIKEETLFDEYFFKDERYINLKLNTPTAFKSGGKYINYPSLELLFKSLMKKYDNSSSDSKIFDLDVIKELKEKTSIVKYNLRSTKYYLEKTRIPSFFGSMTIRIDAPKSLIGLVHFLIKYGEYSAVGMKGSLGMGGLEYIER